MTFFNKSSALLVTAAQRPLLPQMKPIANLTGEAGTFPCIMQFLFFAKSFTYQAIVSLIVPCCPGKLMAKICLNPSEKAMSNTNR